MVERFQLPWLADEELWQYPWRMVTVMTYRPILVESHLMIVAAAVRRTVISSKSPRSFLQRLHVS